MPSVAIEEVERDVTERLRGDLADYRALVAVGWNMVGDLLSRAAAHSAELTHAGKIGMPLLARIQADLRATMRVAETGYALPALTLASSLHENAYISMYIGDSDERAREWMEHQKTHKQYPECGHANVIQAVAPQFGLTADQIERERIVYSQLCWAKHGNPILQRTYGIEQVEKNVLVHQIPYYSQETVRFCRFAIFHAVRPVASAGLVFALQHLADEDFCVIRKTFNQLGDEFKRLGERDDLYRSAE